MLQGITIADLLSTLQSFGIIILKLVLLYLVMRIGSALFVWIWRTVIIPIVEKRSYFYSYNQEGVFYHERRFLGIFRFGRNFRSRINDTLVGYIATKRGRKNENSDANKIYLRRYGRASVGEAKANEDETNHTGENVCNIYLKRLDPEGGTEPDRNPVGYVDKTGKIFKYYEDRAHWIRDEKLEEPAFIGLCATPKSKKWQQPADGDPRPGDTNGERNDADVLQYIFWKGNNSRIYNPNEEAEKEESGKLAETTTVDERRTYWGKNNEWEMDDSWVFFRRNKPLLKKVRCRDMKKGGAVGDGERFPYAFLSSKLWRFLHVYPTVWDCKAMAWGYGYCTEDFRNPFTQNSEDFPMIKRAAAALLLAQKEGFCPDPDEVVSDGVPGAAATALVSLFVYILLYPFLTKTFASYTLFRFLGTEYSSVFTLVGLYFILWLCIINPIRCIFRLEHDGLEAFLELLNKNVGVLGWMSTIVVSTVIGMLGSVFLFGFDYILFPLFFSALTAVLVNWAYYHQEPWAISGIYADFKKDDSQDENNKQEEDEKQEGNEKIKHEAKLELPTKTVTFKETILFDSDKLKDLRQKNPFRNHLTSSYEDSVQEMIQQEFSGMVYSKVLYMRSRVGAYVNKYHLSLAEKVKLIMRICQPENIIYHHDSDSEELLPKSDETAPLPELLKNRNDGKMDKGYEGKGYTEYCRFPTETIHDKRGDCDCHAAYCAAMLAACGFRSCFVTGDVGAEDHPAYHAMCGVENTDDLKAYLRPDNSFEKDGHTFIILETTGRFNLDEVMDFQKRMAEEMNEGKNSVIIEPYQKSI